MTTSPLSTITWLARAPGTAPLPCQREDPRLWFSKRPAGLERAKAFCQPCPLRATCLAGALEREEPHGVWGGEIFEQGAIIARKRSPGRPPKRLDLEQAS